MKTEFHFRQILAMLLMLVAGILPTRAWDHVETFTDDGKENCTFKWNDGDTSPYWVKGGTKGKRRDVSVTDIRAFRTATKFDNANASYKWEWHFRVIPHTIVSNSSDDTRSCKVNGSIYFILDNGDVVKCGDFTKKSWETSINFSWATFCGSTNFEFVNSSGYILFNYMPYSSYVSRIRKIRIYVEKLNYDNRSWGPYEYEKDVNQGFTPLPQPEFAWTDDGRIQANSVNAFDGLSQEKCENQSYEINYSFYSNNSNRNHGPWWFTLYNGTVYSKSNNKISAHDYLNDGDIALFTTPVRFSSTAYITAHEYLQGNEHKETDTWKERKTDWILQPYTHPQDVRTEFDQWNKKMTITWKSTIKMPLYASGTKSDSVDCRIDGTWYVLRYPKDADLDHRVYTLVGSLRGNAAKLQLTDPEELEYSNSYVYRVIFLPELLDNKYKDKISEMPYSSLYAEKAVKAELNVPIVLSQDRTDDTGIKIVWQYSIGKGGCVFRLERRPSGSKAWTEVKSMNADTSLHELSYVDSDNTAITSACDFYDYRIVTTVNGVECASDPLSLCSLPQGTFITDVTATTGTEEGFVVVKWNVVQRGSDDTYFQILRRPIGTEEWTLLTDEIHGTELEYSYVDDRAMVGTYYEYSVRAYGARCEGQVVQSDDKITPGFSQARGTISGHVSFGTGTAVRDVRINLVKSSADEGTDASQFFSRRISGSGKGLTWTADSAKYASLLNGKSPFSLQLWARPAASTSSSKMSLLYLNNTLEIGIKRISDNSDYKKTFRYTNYQDSEGRFVIASASDWEDFVAIVNSTNRYLNAVMMADVDLGSSQSMVGYTPEKAYRGKFDGNGHTLRVGYYVNTANGTSDEFVAAPFRYVDKECKISNLHVTGKISTNTKFAGGIVGIMVSGSSVTLDRCWSSVAIEARSAGDGTHGGLVAMSGPNDITFLDCRFDGSISGAGLTNCGGFIGYVQGDHTATFNRCLVQPASVTVSEGFATFARARNTNNNLHFNNCYYTQALGKQQGTAINVSKLTAATMGSDSWTMDNGLVVPRLTTSELKGLETITNYFFAYYPATIHEADEGINDDLFCLYAIDYTSRDPNAYQVTEFRNLTFEEDDFTHIAARYTGSKWVFTVGNDTLRHDSISVSGTLWDLFNYPNTITLGIGCSQNITSNTFDGYVDDVRLWNRALSDREISNNYSRVLGGAEDGLILYWPLDEGLGVGHYAFDIACQDGIFQLNHPKVGVNARAVDVVPEKLKLYGMTDAEGDYIIRGIPFQQGGTNYKVIPELGIHEFNPNSRSMFISPTSLTSNRINFEDVSSFPMEGHVYFAGTNIPVEGMQFYVDGELCVANGQVSTSDAEGHYLISVPIGKHYVEARLGKHTMVDGGRFPSGTGLHDFTQPVVYDFADSTLVNFVGRVGGGEVNDTLAVGFGASKNNIGIATLKLKINNDGFSFNCADDHISDAATVRTFESDTTSINSKAWSGVGTESKFIYIRTDSLTGEFSAKLPPLKYITRSITIDKNPKIDFVSLPEVDLTNVQMEAQDSLMQISEQGDSTINYYTYNTKLIRTYFSTPKIELRQTKYNYDTDVAEGAFGIRNWYDFEDKFGTINIENIWQVVADTIQYRFGYPIYRTLDSVRMEVYGYEQYVNYDSGTPVTEKLPMKGQILTIDNEMSADQIVIADTSVSELGLMPGDIYDLKSNELILGADGRNEFKWFAGLPNVTPPYTRNLNISYERNGRSRLWDNPLQAIVLGSLEMGSNFVTQGPDVVTMVLRDPPGATSKTTWKTGHTETKVSIESHGFSGDEKAEVSKSVGMKMEAKAGVPGIMTRTLKVELETAEKMGLHYKVNTVDQKTETWSITNTEAISTSTGKPYVGADGDLFMGLSTNFIYGQCRKLGFFRNSATDPFVLDLRNAISLNSEISTSFMYSAYEIEKVMIPKWHGVIRDFMTFVTTEEEARNYENTTNETIYLSWLDPEDSNLGAENTYIPKFPKTEGNPTDTIQTYYNQIDSWKSVLADNEEDKVSAMNSSEYFVRNISFDGGSGNNYSSRCDTTYQKSHIYNHNFTKVFNLTTTHNESLAPTTIKFNIGVKTENGWTMATSSSDYDENTKDWVEVEYAMSDGNKGSDFSVNIYKSPSGWSDIFSILGGQSYNPYEGKRVTKYYEPGLHVLENGTQQMEQPDIQISTDGENAGKSATLIDVPAGQTGQFTLHLTNNGFTAQGFNFSFDLAVNEATNQSGLQILMDGVPANGRSVFIPAGETVKKVITIKQTDPSVLDYEGIELRLASQYQAVKIYDAVTLNAHFKPSSTPIDLVITEPVLNLSTGTNLKAKATNFDRTFKGLSKVGLQYRYENGPTWVTPYSYFVSRKDSTDAGDKPLPSDTDLLMEVDMSNETSYPQGTYTFRAFTMTKYDDEPIYAYSDLVTVIKDNVSPRAITTPTPSNGILGYGEDLSIEFTEDIVPGYVTDKNVIVTARLNDRDIDHAVSYHLESMAPRCRTRNPVFLHGDFSVEFWFKWTNGGTILQQGMGQNMFALSVDNEGYAHAKLAGSDHKSLKTLPKGEWTYVVMSYNSTNMNFSMLAEYGETSILLFEDEKVNEEYIQVVRYADDNYFYMNSDTMMGDIHDLCLFNIYRDVHDAASTKYQAKDNYVYGLTNYWPMNEGHGTVIGDTRHTHDFDVNNLWTLSYENQSVTLDGGEGMSFDLTRHSTGFGDSYAIEMWISPNKFDSLATIFETGSVASNHLRLYLTPQLMLSLQYGDKEKIVADLNHDASEEIYGYWYHIALNVVRGQAASFYLNGHRTCVINETDMPPVEGRRFRIGEGYKGSFDEIRYWTASLSESRLLSNIYNAVDTADIYSRGLVAYFPFESMQLLNQEWRRNFTLKNMAKGATDEISMPENYMRSPITPPLKYQPAETRLVASPVASDRKVVITLGTNTIQPRDIEGTTLKITVDEIHDLNGNESQAISWTAYVQQNTLKWMKDSVNVIKKYGDEATFDVNIVNKSGATEYYTVCNLPQWLTLVDSDNSDEVAPLSEKTLRFKVNPLVAIGNYNATIGIKGNLEIIEPMRVVMKVSGEKPNWTVNPRDYEHQMAFVGQIRIDGILMENPESLVAAFIGDKCRGVASPEQVRGAAYVSLSVYGNDYTSKDRYSPITFRIYDASTGLIYSDAVISLTDGTAIMPKFVKDEFVGSFEEPVIWSKSNQMEQIVPTYQGWNWLGLGIQPDDPAPWSVFHNYTGWSLFIKDKDSSTSYYNGAQWAGTLQVNANVMYKMSILPIPNCPELPSHFTIRGEQMKLDKTPVSISPGWNWIAYTPLVTMTVDEALGGLVAQYGDRVKSQYGFATFSSRGWEGNLLVLEPGNGYMYYSGANESKEFFYPTTTTSSQAPRRARAMDQPRLFTPVDNHLYPDNMTMVVQLVDGTNVVDTAEVAVFVYDECRAAARATDGLYYLIISGEKSGQPMSIYSYIDDVILLLDNSLFYVSDDNIGDPWNPYVIDLQNLRVGIYGVNSDAEDDEEWYTLQGFKLGRRPTEPGIYIHNGQKESVK